MMNGVPVDTRSDKFQIMYRHFKTYRPPITQESQSEFDEISIIEEIENDIRSERQVLGPCYVLERFQRALIVMQNNLTWKLWVKRVHINRELSSIIKKPPRSHKQAMEPTKRINLQLGMKERANGAYYRAYDYDTEISSLSPRK